jgi:hypothetical protein
MATMVTGSGLTRVRPAVLYLREGEAAIVPLPFLDLPYELDVLGERWVRKSEFHITAAHPKTIAAQLRSEQGGSEADALATVQGALARETHAADTCDVALLADARVVRSGEERTIVVMAEVSSVGPLHARLGAALGLVLEAPPTHVTLFTGPEARGGIGLHNAAELSELTEPLPSDEAALVLRLVERAVAGPAFEDV